MCIWLVVFAVQRNASCTSIYEREAKPCCHFCLMFYSVWNLRATIISKLKFDDIKIAFPYRLKHLHETGGLYVHRLLVQTWSTIHQEYFIFHAFIFVVWPCFLQFRHACQSNLTTRAMYLLEKEDLSEILFQLFFNRETSMCAVTHKPEIKIRLKRLSAVTSV